jgi:hypothetical protein
LTFLRCLEETMARSRSTDFDGGGREDAILFFSSVLFFSQLTLVWY